jgi:uncharacterized protein YndB with AHSA1/START domain
VDPFTVSTSVARPREEVFDYLSDVANHSEFTDHYLTHWHLTRVESQGRGAGARFRVEAPLSRYAWADLTLIEVEPPFRLVEAGRGGKNNRIRYLSTFTLSPGPAGLTRVDWTFESDPPRITDRLMEVLLRQRSWLRRKNARALRRLRSILEYDEDRGKRVTVAGR